MLFLGAGNTAGDTVVYVPDARVVAAGDLLVAPTPYGYGCHPSEWIATLKKLMALDAAAIVPRHGPVERDWRYARKVLGLLEAVRERAGAAAARGATFDQTLREVDLEDFRAAFAGEDYGRSRAFRDFFVRDASPAPGRRRGELSRRNEPDGADGGTRGRLSFPLSRRERVGVRGAFVDSYPTVV